MLAWKPLGILSYFMLERFKEKGIVSLFFSLLLFYKLLLNGTQVKQVLFMVIGKYISGRDKDGLEGRNDIPSCYLKIAFMAACCDSASWLGLWVAEWIQQVEASEVGDRKHLLFMLLQVY